MTKMIEGLEGLYDALGHYDKVFMIHDEAVGEFADAIASRAGIGATLSICASSECKTIDSVMLICRFLLEFGADRDALVLAVGGGTTLDMVGFAAAIYKRGVRCAYVPTTVLSQVDAAIGGKTGVNLDWFKNILGTFTMPEFLCTCSEPLKTLPHRDFVSGFAELLKTFIVADAGLYRKAVELLPEASETHPESIAGLIAAAAGIKSAIVARDPFEKGERRALNLGHTFAHAVEWFEQTHDVENPMTHGEAVAAGIVAAAELSEKAGVAGTGLAARLARDFAACGLPTEIPYDMEELEEAIKNDKKAQDGRTRFVLIKEIGEVLI